MGDIILCFTRLIYPAGVQSYTISTVIRSAQAVNYRANEPLRNMQ